MEIIEEFYTNSTLVEGGVHVDSGEVVEEDLRTDDVAFGISEGANHVGMMEVEGVLGGHVYGFDAAVVVSTEQEIYRVPEELDSNDDDIDVSASFPDLDQEQGFEMIFDESEAEYQEESVVENHLLDSSDNHVRADTPFNEERNIFFEISSSEKCLTV